MGLASEGQTRRKEHQAKGLAWSAQTAGALGAGWRASTWGWGGRGQKDMMLHLAPALHH